MASACPIACGTVGTGRVLVTFAPTGRSTQALVTGGLAGTPAGSCVAAKLKNMSLTPTGLGPAEFGNIVKRDLGYWDAVVKKVGEK